MCSNTITDFREFCRNCFSVANVGIGSAFALYIELRLLILLYRFLMSKIKENRTMSALDNNIKSVTIKQGFKENQKYISAVMLNTVYFLIKTYLCLKYVFI